MFRIKPTIAVSLLILPLEPTWVFGLALRLRLWFSHRSELSSSGTLGAEWSKELQICRILILSDFLPFEPEPESHEALLVGRVAYDTDNGHWDPRHRDGSPSVRAER